jgi:hypothetical protein
MILKLRPSDATTKNKKAQNQPKVEEEEQKKATNNHIFNTIQESSQCLSGIQIEFD